MEGAPYQSRVISRGWRAPATDEQARPSGLRFQAVRLAPQCVEIEREPFAPGDLLDDALRLADGLHVAPVGPELEHLEAPERQVDDPVEAHAKRSVFLRLLDTIPSRVLRPRRNDLDHDVGRRPHEPLRR